MASNIPPNPPAFVPSNPDSASNNKKDVKNTNTEQQTQNIFQRLFNSVFPTTTPALIPVTRPIVSLAKKTSLKKVIEERLTKAQDQYGLTEIPIFKETPIPGGKKFDPAASHNPDTLREIVLHFSYATVSLIQLPTESLNNPAITLFKNDFFKNKHFDLVVFASKSDYLEKSKTLNYGLQTSEEGQQKLENKCKEKKIKNGEACLIEHIKYPFCSYEPTSRSSPPKEICTVDSIIMVKIPMELFSSDTKRLDAEKLIKETFNNSFECIKKTSAKSILMPFIAYDNFLSRSTHPIIEIDDYVKISLEVLRDFCNKQITTDLSSINITIALPNGERLPRGSLGPYENHLGFPNQFEKDQIAYNS